MVRLYSTAFVTFFFVSMATSIGFAELPPQPKDEAPLIVEGVVREVFRSARTVNIDYIVQIEVASSAAGKAARNPVRLALPAPGDSIYVHLFQRRPDAPKIPSPSGFRAIPAERSTIKAYLYPRQQGGWQGAYPDWFDVTSREIAPRGDADPDPAAEDLASGPQAPAIPGPSLRSVGLRLTRLELQGKGVYRVVEVLPGTPAAKAGIEPGDFVLDVNGKLPANEDEFNGLIKSSGANLILSVLDIKKGEPVQVKVDIASLLTGPANTAPVTPQPDALHAHKLGIKVESVQAGNAKGVRVVKIMPEGPAAKAGFEVGDVILEVSGLSTTTTEELNEAVRKGGALLTVMVLDKNSGKKVPVKVNVGTIDPEAAGRPKPVSPDPSVPANPATKAQLGVSVDFDLVDGTSGLKILQVQPDGLAQQAGLTKGQVIIEANETIALNGEQLDEIVKKSGPVLKLKIFDPDTRKKSVIEIKLGNSR